MLCRVVLRCIALRCAALRCVALRCVVLCCVVSCCVGLRCVALNYVSIMHGIYAWLLCKCMHVCTYELRFFWGRCIASYVEIVPLGYPEMCLGLWARKDAEGFVEAMWLQKVPRKV